MPDALLLHREMSARPDEFLRELRLAFPSGIAVEGDVARVTSGDVSLRAEWRVGPPRQIANLRLPTLHVSLHFAGGTADARDALLARMDRAMHRGGG